MFDFIKKVYFSYLEDKAMAWAAAVAYFTTFSIAPMLLIAISVAGLFYESQDVRGEIFNQIESLLGPEGASAIQTMISAASREGGGILGTIIGFLILAWTSSSVFRYLQLALDQIWHVDQKEGNIKTFAKARAISFGMVLTIGFILLVSLIISAVLSAFWGRVDNYLPFSSTFIAGMDFIVSLLIITLLFAALFKILPHADLQWKHVWFGGFVTAALFVIGKTAIGFYIGQSDLASSYGSVGSLIIILIWVFYSAQIFFFGSEITKVYVQKKGQIITPSSDAVKIERVEKEQEKL